MILGTGTILGLLAFGELCKVIKSKEKTIFADFVVFSWICAFVTVALCGVFLSGAYTVASRYVAFLIPLFFIIGFKSIARWSNKKIFLVISPLIFILYLFLLVKQTGEMEIVKCYFLSLSNSLPVNVLFMTSFIIVLFTIFTVILYTPNLNIKKKKTIAKYAAIGTVWLLIISGANIDFHDRVICSQTMFNKEVIGKYLQEHQNYDEEIIFDESIYPKFKDYFWKLKFWSNNKIRLGDKYSGDFFVTSEKLSYSLITQQELCYNTNTTIYLYELQKEKI